MTYSAKEKSSSSLKISKALSTCFPILFIIIVIVAGGMIFKYMLCRPAPKMYEVCLEDCEQSYVKYGIIDDGTFRYFRADLSENPHYKNIDHRILYNIKQVYFEKDGRMYLEGTGTEGGIISLGDISFKVKEE